MYECYLDPTNFSNHLRRVIMAAPLVLKESSLSCKLPPSFFLLSQLVNLSTPWIWTLIRPSGQEKGKGGGGFWLCTWSSILLCDSPPPLICSYCDLQSMFYIPPFILCWRPLTPSLPPRKQCPPSQKSSNLPSPPSPPSRQTVDNYWSLRKGS